MIQGTSSGAGKSMLVTALCRILTNKGFKVAPFKSQNMSSFTYKIKNTDKIIANAQAIQAMASRVIPDSSMNPILLKPIGNNKSRIYTNGKFLSVMEAKDFYLDFVLNKGLRIALGAFMELRSKYEIIIPGKTNTKNPPIPRNKCINPTAVSGMISVIPFLKASSTDSLPSLSKSRIAAELTADPITSITRKNSTNTAPNPKNTDGVIDESNPEAPVLNKVAPAPEITNSNTHIAPTAR